MNEITGWMADFRTEGADEPIVLHRKPEADVDLDITPMIDITFLLLIFFLVASVPDPQTAVDLPGARYGGGVSTATSTVLTVADRGGPGRALVYLGDGKVGEPLPDDVQQQYDIIHDKVESGLASDSRNHVLIKAEKGVLYRDVARVATAAAIEGVSLHLAVKEIE